MEKTILLIERQFDKTANETDKGLDNQSFFNTTEKLGRKIPTGFIMQRMFRAE